MMRRVRRTSLLVVLCVLASAGTVYAECPQENMAAGPRRAWVLWERWVSEATGDSWTALGCKVSQWECNRARESEYAQAVRKGVERIEGALKVNDQTFIVYTCLPDTIDPRGSKGGRR